MLINLGFSQLPILALTSSNTNSIIKQDIVKDSSITKIDTNSCDCYTKEDVIACPICGCTAADPSMIGMCTIGKKPGETNLKNKSNEVDSLVGNLVLSKALQNDELLAKYYKKAGYGSTAMLGGILGISGVSMSSAIVGINTLNQPVDSSIPSTLAIISGGLTLGTFGLYIAYRAYYNKKITKRQDFITKQVKDLLTNAEKNGFTENFKNELTSLIGETSYKEFTRLWIISHDPDLDTYIKKLSNKPAPVVKNETKNNVPPLAQENEVSLDHKPISKVSKNARAYETNNQ